MFRRFSTVVDVLGPRRRGFRVEDFSILLLQEVLSSQDLRDPNSSKTLNRVALETSSSVVKGKEGSEPGAALWSLT